MDLSGIRKAGAQIRSAAKGTFEVISFLVAGTSAILQFLLGQWPEPVVLGAPKRRRRGGQTDKARGRRDSPT